jgi:hypothetical protein
MGGVWVNISGIIPVGGELIITKGLGIILLAGLMEREWSYRVNRRIVDIQFCHVEI